MTNKFKNQTDTNLRKGQVSKAFFMQEMMDLRSWKSALLNLYEYEAEPMYIKGQYLYI
jgi:hypothetical protein